MRIRPPVVAIPFVLLAAIHIGITTVYLMPTNVLKLRMETLIENYMYPLFGQSWHLFSPNPGLADDTIWIRYRTPDGTWLEWRDPSFRIRQAHEYRIFISPGRRLRIYDGLANRLREQFEIALLSLHPDDTDGPTLVITDQDREAAVNRIIDSKHYLTAVRYAIANVPENVNVEAFQIHLIRTVPPTISQLRENRQHPPATEVVEFPITEISSR